ncbi:hypothetical protein M23134_08003 [Microscilla marina ATCC 23134]|uniref:Uncharacterized protein n=1 Tax=Microscilla marina ATCC 23134 TaxID=313606 RepID=A1ZWM6_MICM2|nr:hypothetical protein M23134_08003 [Microscilla marina ATCC 23134]
MSFGGCFFYVQTVNYPFMTPEKYRRIRRKAYFKNNELTKKKGGNYKL